MMRMTKFRNISLQDAKHILFPRRMASYGFRCFSSKLEDAAREDKLDFITASKLLFTPLSKPKTFGFDFHLVQFFFACMPSLAVYLVAQYARYDMRKMEAELEEKKRLTEEALVEELELEGQSSSEAGSPGNLKERKLDEKCSDLSKVSRKEKEEALQELKHRLDVLEAIVKDMTSTEARKSSDADRAKSRTEQEEEPINEKVALTCGQRDVDKYHGERTKSKDTASVDNVNSRNASLQPNKNSFAREECKSNANQGS